MNISMIQKLGGCALIAGALMMAVYSIGFPLLLPVAEATGNFTKLVQNPHWQWLAGMAFGGVVLMMSGFAAVYSRICGEAGVVGLLGFVFLEAAYMLQACKVTWELCLYPVIADNAGAAPLLRDQLLKQSAPVGLFRLVATVAIGLGIALFCTALVRSRTFPRLAGVLIFAGALVYALHPTLLLAIAGIFTLSVGCLVLGLALARGPAPAAGPANG